EARAAVVARARGVAKGRTKAATEVGERAVALGRGTEPAASLTGLTGAGSRTTPGPACTSAPGAKPSRHPRHSLPPVGSLQVAPARSDRVLTVRRAGRLLPASGRHEPDEPEEDHRADEGGDQAAEKTPGHDAEDGGEHPAAHQGPHHTDDDVTEHAVAVS